VLAGMQAAFRGMIERFDPDALEKRFEKYNKSGLMQLGQKGKKWEAYKKFHEELVNNMDNSFQHLFGYDFVQAYEEQMQRLAIARKADARKKSTI
jgi:type VI secretion system protein